jgi:polyisoprenyl-teichoic acid--peptidoglycan teichoic acid transferase
MNEFRPGEEQSDPEAYQALLKRWGLDDESLGIGEFKAGAATAAGDNPAAAIEPDPPEPIDEADPSETVDGPEPSETTEDTVAELETDPPIEAVGIEAVGEANPSIGPEAEAAEPIVGESLGLDLFTEDSPSPIGEDVVEIKRRRVWFRRSMIAVATVFALILGTAGFYAVVGLNALQSIKRDPAIMPTDDGYQTVPPVNTGPLNFVLLGSDSRSQSDPGRSDTMMVAHLNGARNNLYLVSVPRDIYVDIPDHGKNKINAAYAFGGSALTIKTLQNLTGTRMNHTIIIDFEGFIGLTTDVGGVTVFNEIPSTNLGFDFPRGDISLSGEQALAYVRQRYDLPRGDFDREARQRAVVKALILKLMNPETLANPATFNAVATKLGRNLTVDDKLTNDLIWSLATNLSIKSARDIRQIQVPIAKDATINGSSVLLIDPERMAKLSTALQTDQLGPYWAEYGED